MLRCRLFLAVRHLASSRRELVLIGCACGLYQLIGLLRGRRVESGRRNALTMLRLERRLLIDVEHRLQRRVLPYPLALTLCNGLYLINQYAVAPAAFWALYRTDYRAYTNIRNQMLTALSLAAVWHAVQPVSPPRLLGVGIVDTIQLHTPVNLESRLVRSLYTPNAAMPSLHMTAALLGGRALWECSGNPAVRIAAIGYPVSIAFVVMVTGNHFLVDIAGAYALIRTTAVLVRRRIARSDPAGQAQGVLRAVPDGCSVIALHARGRGSSASRSITACARR